MCLWAIVVCLKINLIIIIFPWSKVLYNMNNFAFIYHRILSIIFPHIAHHYHQPR